VLGTKTKIRNLYRAREKCVVGKKQLI